MHQVMEWNEDVSAQVRRTLQEQHVCLVNVMGSPGAGKTTLLTALIEKLRPSFSIGVIEGDITGQIDAEKIAALRIPAVQLNTDGACHIEAMSIQHILPQFDLASLDVIFVENVGNLVCPAEFDIGEAFRLTILSVPEGDDKVAKYPLMFTDTDCLAVSKCDVAPYFDFDFDRVRDDYRGVNPQGPLFPVSARTGEGVDALAEHIAAAVRRALAGNRRPTAVTERAPGTRRVRVEIGGLVQGVGFRPFLHRQAAQRGLSGFARNTPDGVLFELEGPAAQVEDCLRAVRGGSAPAGRGGILHGAGARASRRGRRLFHPGKRAGLRRGAGAAGSRPLPPPACASCAIPRTGATAIPPQLHRLRAAVLHPAPPAV